MTGLSDEDIKEAAAEAGISPAELREALGENSKALVRAPDRSVAVPGQPGVVLSARANIPQPPDDAVRNVRSAIESQIGQRGHMQGTAAGAIFDEERGVIYRVRGDEDGQGGALVAVDIDAAPSKGKRTLAKVGMGATLAVLGMGSLLFGSWIALGVTAAIGVLGFGAIAAAGKGSQIGYDQAHAIASHALIEAEERAPAPKALPPA